VVVAVVDTGVDYSHTERWRTARRPTTCRRPATYHFRLVAQNAFGTSYGPDRAFTTP